MTLGIRAASEADLPAVARIVADTPLWQRYGVTRERAEAALAAGRSRGDALSVAEDAGAVAGLAWVLPAGGFGRSPYLKWLGVRSGATSRGLGAALLRAAEASAQVIRPELFLLCSDFNVGARRFYEREGYRRVGALPDYVLSGVTELVYFKRW